MANEGKKDLEFKEAPDGSYSINGKSSPKSEERKEPKFDTGGSFAPETTVDKTEKETSTSDEGLENVFAEELDKELKSTNKSVNSNVELNKAVEDVKEGDMSSISSHKVVYGAARDAVLKKQAADVETKTGYKADAEEQEKSESQKSPEEEALQDKEVGRKLENGADKKETAEYKEARAEWLSARERSNTLKTEYNQKYEAYLQDQAKENSFKKGWRATRKWLGLKPKLSEELVKLGHAAEVARRDHFEASNKIKEIRLGDVQDAARSVREGKPVSEASRETTVGQIYDVDKLMNRYGRMLSYKLVISPRKEQIAIQEGVAGSFPESATSKRIKSSLETMRKYRYVRWGATAVGYGVLAGATGGLGVAALAGGGYAARVAGAVGLGGYFGTMFRAAGEKREGNKAQALSVAESQASNSLFERGYTETDAEIEKLTRAVEVEKAKTRITSSAAAVGFGVIGGGLSGVVADSVEFGSGGTNTKIPPIKEMGDASVAEKMYPEVKEAFNEDGVSTPREITPESPNHADMTPPSGGSEAVPQDNGKELMQEDLSPDHEPHSDEDVYENSDEDENNPENAGEPITHTVERGDNAWNIMEGKGPDNNPVGGKSEIVTDMSVQDRRYWLDKVFDYCDKNPDFAKEVGAVKSGGNIHLIHPGETVDVSMLDQKIVELMNQEAGNNIPTPTPRPEDVVSGESLITTPDVSETSTESTPRAEQFSESGPVKMVTGPQMESYSDIKDFNKLTILEVEKIAFDISQNNPGVEARLEELDIDKNDFKGRYESMSRRGGELKPEMTVTEWLTNSDKMTDDLPPSPKDNSEPPATPFGDTLPQPGDMPVRDASFIPEAANDNGAAVKAFVNGVENQKPGLIDSLFFGGGPNISGTWEALNPDQMTIGQFKELVSSPNLQAELSTRGLSAEGVTAWGETLQKQDQLIPAQNDETLISYLERVTSGQRIA